MTYHNAQKFVLSAPLTSNDLHYERVKYLSSLLGSPQKSFKYLRLAGSNGKTICSALLSSVLAEAGYKVCTLNMSLFGDARENIRINSEPLSMDYFTSLVQKISAACTLMRKKTAETKKALEQEEITETDKRFTISHPPLHYRVHGEITRLSESCHRKTITKT